VVFDQMVRNKYLSEGEAANLKKKQYNSFRSLNETAGLAPYFQNGLVKN